MRNSIFALDMQHVKQLNHHLTLQSFDALSPDYSSCNELYLKHFVLLFIDIIWIQIFAMSNSSFVLIIPSLLNQLFISELNFSFEYFLILLSNCFCWFLVFHNYFFHFVYTFLNISPKMSKVIKLSSCISS